MINKLVHGITGLLLPIGLYGASSHSNPLPNYRAYNRSSVSSAAMSVHSSASGGVSPNIKPLESHFLLSGTIAGEVQLTRGKRELVIIDEAVPDKHLLSSYLRPGVDIVQINSGEDGLSQLEEILAGYQDLDALHIVSHGRAGELYLGDTPVDKQQLQQRPSVLAALDKALNDGADLLLFGCDIAATDEGDQLLEIIANEAHVDVAASNDLTGNAALGGDWDLEVMVGQIDTEQPFSEIALKDFSAVLQTTEVFENLGFIDGSYDFIGGNPAATYTIVGGDFDSAAAYMYWTGATPATMYIAADGDDAESFNVDALNFYGIGGSVTIDETSYVIFENAAGGQIKQMDLSVDTALTTTSTSIFDFFDVNNAVVADVAVIKIYIDIASGHTLQDIAFESITIDNITAPGGGGDSTPPTISAVSIPNSNHKVGDEVTATITVTSDTDDYTTATTPITGTIAGYALGSLSKTNDTTYTATFTITDAGTDVAAGNDVPVNFTLDDSSDNNSIAFTTAISQASDAIYANVPDVTLTADTNTIVEDGGVSTLTASLTNSLNNQWPAAVTVNLAYTGTGTAATDYSKSDSIVISAGNSSGTATVTGTADTLFDAAVAETAIVDIDSLSVGNEGAPNQQTISITDAESAPSVTLSVANSSIDEDGGTSTITAALSHPTFADVTVNLAYSGTATGGGTDYATPSSSIIISALSTSADASTGITAVDDGDILADVNVIIDITSVTGGGGATENGTQQKTITIPDDDGDSIPPSITAVSIAEDEYYLNGFVGVSIRVAPDADDYTTGSGGISGRINGVRLHTLNRVNDTTYVSVFRVTEDVTERAKGEPIPVSITLTDSNGNTSATFSTSITQANTSIATTPQEVSISGNITDSGSAAEGILIYVYDVDGEFIAAAASGNSGNYNIGGLAAGEDYRVDVYDSDALDAQIPVESSTVTATAEGVVLDFSLGPMVCEAGFTGADCSISVDDSLNESVDQLNTELDNIQVTTNDSSGNSCTATNITVSGSVVISDSYTRVVVAAFNGSDLVDGITLENATNGSTVSFTLVDLPSGTYVIKALGYNESTAFDVTTETVTAEISSSEFSQSTSGLILSFADGASGDYATSSCSGQLSTQTVTAIEDSMDTVTSLAEETKNEIESGTVDTSTAMALADTATNVLQKVGDAIQDGGNVDEAKANQTLNSVTTVLEAIKTSGTSLSGTDVSIVENVANKAIMAATDLIEDSTTEDEAKELIDNAEKLIGASQELTGSIQSDLVLNVQILSQTALENTLDDIAKKLDPDSDVKFTSVEDTQTLLSSKPELLKAVLDTVGVEVTSTSSSQTQTSSYSSSGWESDDTEAATRLENAGLSTDSATALASDLAQFSNPNTVSVNTPSGKVTATDSITNAIAGDTTATVDNNTKTLAVTVEDQEFSVAVQSTKLVPESIPNGVTVLPNGTAVAVSDGLASTLTPALKDPVSFSRKLNNADSTVRLNNGEVAITSTDGEAIVGTPSPLIETSDRAPGIYREENNNGDDEILIVNDDGSAQRMTPTLQSFDEFKATAESILEVDKVSRNLDGTMIVTSSSPTLTLKPDFDVTKAEEGNQVEPSITVTDDGDFTFTNENGDTQVFYIED